MGGGHSDTYFFCCHHMEIGRVGLAAHDGAKISDPVAKEVASLAQPA